MAWWFVVSLVGFLLTLFGTVLAAVPLKRSWDRHAATSVVPVPGFLRRVHSYLLGTPQIVRVGAPIDARVELLDPRVTGGPGITDETPDREAIERLYRRMAVVEQQVLKDWQAQQRVNDALRAGWEARAEALAGTARSLEERTRELAIGSVRMQLLGLVLVGLGTVLTTVPALVMLGSEAFPA